MAFSFSRKHARRAISSSLAFRASRDFFAARLFLFRLSKYLPSFCSSGIGLFSLRGLRGRVEAKAREITGEAVKKGKVFITEDAAFHFGIKNIPVVKQIYSNTFLIYCEHKLQSVNFTASTKN